MSGTTFPLSNGLRLPKLQYLRAVAAMAVVVYHASFYLGAIREVGAFYSFFDGYFGRFGVTLFFAISGYLMARLAPQAIPSRFLLHRIFRIYPIYLVVAVVVLTAWQVPMDWKDLLGSLSLVPGPHAYALGVEWTLPYELAFYILVTGAVLFGLGDRLHWIGCSWVLLLLVLTLFSFSPDSQDGNFPTISHILLSEICFAFAVGLLVPEAVSRWSFGPVATAIAAVAIIAGVYAGNYGMLLTSCGVALLVGWAATPSATPRAPIKAMVLLGDWSFALYLVHVPVIKTLLQWLPLTWPPLTNWLLLIAGAVVVACFAGTLDVALYRRVKDACDSLSAAPRVLICLSFLTLFFAGGVYLDASVRQSRQPLLNAEALGRKIDALPAEGSVAQRMERLNLRASTSLVGYVDAATFTREGKLMIDGWVVDQAAEEVEPAILFFLSGKYVGAAVPSVPRPDVLTKLNTAHRGRMAGFSARLTLGECKDHSPLEAAVVARDLYALIPVAATAQVCSARGK